MLTNLYLLAYPAVHRNSHARRRCKMSPLPGGSFVINEQATFAPDSNHRWMGSAAMDSNGNIAVGYSVSSANTFPSIRYAARLATDPPGGLIQRRGGSSSRR